MKWTFHINLVCSYQWYCTLAKAVHLFPGTLKAPCNVAGVP